MRGVHAGLRFVQRQAREVGADVERRAAAGRAVQRDVEGIAGAQRVRRVDRERAIVAGPAGAAVAVTARETMIWRFSLVSGLSRTTTHRRP